MGSFGGDSVHPNTVQATVSGSAVARTQLSWQLAFLQNRLVPQFVPAEFVHGQLLRGQATSSFNHCGGQDIPD